MHQADLDIRAGQIVWLRGSSGAGKSVLLKLLSGLLELSDGEYLINGEAVQNMSFDEFLKYRLNIGYGFDYGGLINNRSIESNLSLPCEYHSFLQNHLLNDHLKKYMKLFDLENVAQERPSNIIGGQRKAACVARAFMLEPEVMFLDDPTTGLRGAVRVNLKNHMIRRKEENKNFIYLIATEDSDFMKDFYTDIIEIHNGQLKYEKREKAS